MARTLVVDVEEGVRSFVAEALEDEGNETLVSGGLTPPPAAAAPR